MEVLEAVGPLNKFLRDLHGPTDDISRTMRRLVPFPDEISSLADADLLDLSVSVQAETSSGASAKVRAQARYATSARVGQARDFYIGELQRVGATGIDVSQADGDDVLIHATLADERRTTYRVRINRSRGYRSVKVSAHYSGFDYHEFFARFACWHNGDAPVSTVSEPTGLEVSTFASGRGPNTLVLYSTYYDSPRVSRTERRATVDNRLDELGWTYVEPREGIMFIQDSVFDAEMHIEGDDSSSCVTFVGEFALP